MVIVTISSVQREHLCAVELQWNLFGLQFSYWEIVCPGVGLFGGRITFPQVVWGPTVFWLSIHGSDGCPISNKPMPQILITVASWVMLQSPEVRMDCLDAAKFNHRTSFVRLTIDWWVWDTWIWGLWYKCVVALNKWMGISLMVVILKVKPLTLYVLLRSISDKTSKSAFPFYLEINNSQDMKSLDRAQVQTV